MYKISIKFRNNDEEYYDRIVKSMPQIGESIRLSIDSPEGYKFFLRTARVVDIIHTAFVEGRLYHENEPHAIVVISPI